MTDEPTQDRPGPVGPTDAARNPPTSVGSVGVPGRGTEPPFITRHRYQDASGIEVVLVCPWGPGSNRIPPPRIAMGDGVWFRYVGTDDPDAE